MSRWLPPRRFYPSRRPSKRALLAVLAGGKGTRLHGGKPSTPLAGQPLVLHPLLAAAEAGLEAVVFAKPDSVLPPLPCPVVREPQAPSHPLCGIVAALRHAAPRPVLVVGCDMPFLPAEMLSWLADLDGAAIVKAAGRVQPLLGRYLPAQLPALERALDAQAPLCETVLALVPRLLGVRDIARFGEPERLLFNVNHPADLARAEALFAASGG